MTFAEGACETRSRSEEEAMQGHRRRQGTQRSPATPSAQGVAAGRHRFLCRSSSAMRIDISSSSLRKLDAVALATNVTVFMKRGTKCRPSLLSFFTTARQHDSTTARQHDSTTARQHDSTTARHSSCRTLDGDVGRTGRRAVSVVYLSRHGVLSNLKPGGVKEDLGTLLRDPSGAGSPCK